jgi:N-glycosylase/DNA lyase
MVENLCTHYGPCVAQIGDTSFHAFPAIEDLATDGVEAHLRKLGFGYRAAYIAKTAKQLLEAGGRSYLLQLRTKSYDEAKSALLKFTGVGPKVADCILLMSLDQPAAIPVDTHMFQIAANKYLPHLKGYKSVTDRVYTEIGDHFRKLYGPYAGWAHSVLFSADLRHLQDVAPLDKKDIKNEDTPPPAKKKTKNVKKKK